jgi:hypothetical protein
VDVDVVCVVVCVEVDVVDVEVVTVVLVRVKVVLVVVLVVLVEVLVGQPKWNNPQRDNNDGAPGSVASLPPGPGRSSGSSLPRPSSSSPW